MGALVVLRASVNLVDRQPQALIQLYDDVIYEAVGVWYMLSPSLKLLLVDHYPALWWFIAAIMIMCWCGLHAEPECFL